jgi:S-disulfanyl-L-cysteine oxidoreductase SoxD
MRCSHSFVFALMVLGVCGVARAQTPDYKNVGRTPTADEIRAWDISIGPEGKELPPGSGSAKEGVPIFAAKCASCHGSNGEGGANGIGGPRILEASALIKNTPYATSLWGYVNNDMPWKRGLSLKPEEVYALTALVLARNGIIKDTDVMDAKSLPQVRMPGRDKYVPARPTYKPNAPNEKP